MVVAEFEDDGGDHDGDAHAVDGCADELQLLDEHSHLQRVSTAAAELLGDGAVEPAALGQLAVEAPVVDRALGRGVDHVLGEMVGDELAHLQPERLGMRGKRPVHQATASGRS